VLVLTWPDQKSAKDPGHIRQQHSTQKLCVDPFPLTPRGNQCLLNIICWFSGMYVLDKGDKVGQTTKAELDTFQSPTILVAGDGGFLCCKVSCNTKNGHNLADPLPMARPNQCRLLYPDTFNSSRPHFLASTLTLSKLESHISRPHLFSPTLHPFTRAVVGFVDVVSSTSVTIRCDVADLCHSFLDLGADHGSYRYSAAGLAIRRRHRTFVKGE